MRILKAKDYQHLSRLAANVIAAQIIQKPNCVLGLATGSTPIGAYNRLVELYQAGELDFSDVTTINLDEYKGIERSNDQSYYYFMHNNLFNHVNIKEENVNLPMGIALDSQSECARYDAIIAEKGLDLQLLGIGHNGHIGFNEPSSCFAKGTNCVDLTQSTIDANKRFFANESLVPRQAYTMGIGSILQAKKVLMVICGKDKAEILKKSFFGPITPEVPASILQLHSDVVLVADEAALSLI